MTFGEFLKQVFEWLEWCHDGYTRKEADEQLSAYVTEPGTRLFLLKNLYLPAFPPS